MDAAVTRDVETLGMGPGLASARAQDALLDRAAHGQPEAFDTLIRPRLDKLYRMALTITRSDADARDAVQEACVLAWRELPRLRQRDRFDSWLAQILVNACRGHLRKQRRLRVREVGVEDVVTEASAAVAYHTGGGQEEVAEIDLIRRAFERLDGDTRALIAMHYVEQRPIAEISRVMGQPAGTIKWRLSNARRALDKALEAERR
jgi:RNA polymerase sigma-70 factor (ECF subfamily)